MDDRSISSFSEEEEIDVNGDNERFQSLFTSQSFDSVYDTIKYDQLNYKFNIMDYIAQRQLEDIETIKVINFIRKENSQGRSAQEIQEKLNLNKWDNDLYMQPVLQDDGMLMFDYQEALLKNQQYKRESQGQPLQIQNQQLKQALEEQQIIISQLQGLVSDLVVEDGQQTSKNQENSLSKQRDIKQQLKQDKNYFSSYDIGMQKQMLKDQPRTLAYKDAIIKNPQLFRNKRVLDVGCGSGILSLFALKAGAKEVIAFEANQKIASLAQKTVNLNIQQQQLHGKFKVIDKKIEDVQAPNDIKERADIVISEWMGYGFFFESMLQSVMYAREKWLKPQGAILPDRGAIYIAGICRNQPSFWEDVYGFNMTPFAQQEEKQRDLQADVLDIKKEDIVTNTCLIKEFDFSSLELEDTYFNEKFRFKLNQQSIEQIKLKIQSWQQQSQYQDQDKIEHKDRFTLIQGFGIWFDTSFSNKYCQEFSCKLDTSPYSQQTHWGQLYLPLKTYIDFNKDFINKILQNQDIQNQIQIYGQISMQKHHEIQRGLLITVQYASTFNQTKDDIFYQYEMLPN